jgi:MYXO-CTERM domain-containing protein
MKKLLLLAVCLGSAATMFGQGTVAFHNNGSTTFRLWTNNAALTASNLMSGAAYRVGLYGSTDLSASEGSLSLLLMTTNAAPAAAAGRFNGGSAVPIAGIAGGQIRFQLRAWSIAGGDTYEAARTASLADPLNIALGTSPLGTTTLGGGIVPPGALFGTSPGQLTEGFQVAPIPEPSSIALGLLGLGAIALFRRRK